MRAAPVLALVVAVHFPGAVPVDAPPPETTLGSPTGAPLARAVGGVAWSQEGSTRWEWPVAAAVVDWFRPPSSPWGAGNRGWEFDTHSGDPVRAVGRGVVRWAGRVAGRGVVTIDHGGGLLSSVTGLAAIEVSAGQSVRAGARIGSAMPSLHLGFRLDGRYVDPARFLQRPTHAVLVPVPD
ncbi:MAG: murein hydrolase activator EnvC family protein [Microthrixaceae bacterium]